MAVSIGGAAPVELKRESDACVDIRAGIRDRVEVLEGVNDNVVGRTNGPPQLIATSIHARILDRV